MCVHDSDKKNVNNNPANTRKLAETEQNDWALGLDFWLSIPAPHTPFSSILANFNGNESTKV